MRQERLLLLPSTRQALEHPLTAMHATSPHTQRPWPLGLALLRGLLGKKMHSLNRAWSHPFSVSTR